MYFSEVSTTPAQQPAAAPREAEPRERVAAQQRGHQGERHREYRDDRGVPQVLPQAGLVVDQGRVGQLSRAARARVDALFADESPSDDLVAEVVGIVADAGGLSYARARGAQFADEANEALRTMPDSPVRAALADATSPPATVGR